MPVKARDLRLLLKEAVHSRVDLYEGSPLATVRGLSGWPSDLSTDEEVQALEALRALRSLHSEQEPATVVQAVATARTLQGTPSIEGALSRVMEGCRSNLLSLSLTWSPSVMALIDEVAARGCAITLVGNEEDGAFRQMVALWRHPQNKPVALVARDVKLMHIKAVVADRRRGYLGSGNLTAGGTKHNMELGVAFEGELGEQIWRFIDSQRRAGYLAQYTQ